MKKNKKPILIIGGAIVFLLVVVLMSKKNNSDRTPVTVQEASIGNITEIVEASGKIQPETEVRISSDISGEIIAIFIKEGDKVKQGDLLCKINPDLVESAYNRAGAALNQAKANLANAKAQEVETKARFIATEASYRRNKRLYDQNTISREEYETAESSYLVGQARVLAAKETVNGARFSIKSAEASLKEAQDNLERTAIFAPMDGTVSQLNKEKGERVVGTGQMEGTEIMTIANLEIMEATVEVNESNIIRVSLNDTAWIEVDAYPGRKFKGMITEIANTANSTVGSLDQATHFEVKIRLSGGSYKDLENPAMPHLSPFRPGMSTTVEIHTETVENVVVVPVESVTSREDTALQKPLSDPSNRPETDQKKSAGAEAFICVFVVKDHKAHLRVVETGIQNSTFIRIKSGIQPGEKIVTGDFEAISKTLMNGSPVWVEKDKEEKKN